MEKFSCEMGGRVYEEFVVAYGTRRPAFESDHQIVPNLTEHLLAL